MRINETTLWPSTNDSSSQTRNFKKREHRTRFDSEQKTRESEPGSQMPHEAREETSANQVRALGSANLVRDSFSF